MKYILVLFILLALSACGRENVLEKERVVRRLSVFTFESPEILHSAAYNLQTHWDTARPNHLLDFRFHTMEWYDRHNIVSHFKSMFAAGQSYDMILMWDMPVWELANSGYLTNIYTLMDADPFTNRFAADTSRDDFFHQPLRALEINGGLYHMPVGFGLHYVSINTALPEHIIGRFANSSTVTLHDMMILYLEIVRDPEFEHMHFSSGFPGGYSPLGAVAVYIGNYINFDARTADLQNEKFLDFLAYTREIFNRPVRFGIPTGLPPLRTFQNIISGRYHVFHVDTHFANPVMAFVDAQHRIEFVHKFYHGRPMADNRGRLLMDTWTNDLMEFGLGFANMHTNFWDSVSFPVMGNSELAWEFIQFNMEFFNLRQFAPSNAIASPIVRELFEPNVSAAFRGIGLAPVVTPFNIDIRECEYTLDAVLAGISALNEMPMAPVTSHIPAALFADDLDEFMDGAISEEALARRLQGIVMHWLAQ